MKATRYFVEQVLRKRPYLDEAMCRAVLADPLRREAQPDGRIRHWGEARLANEEDARILRVVTLEDGETLHNRRPTTSPNLAPQGSSMRGRFRVEEA